jgi:hypothetical protein
LMDRLVNLCKSPLHRLHNMGNCIFDVINHLKIFTTNKLVDSYDG